MDAKTRVTAQKHMARAIALAKQGLGFVEPNPMVGCVLVAGGQVIGQGYHQRYGQAHGEVMALGDCSADPAGCDVYVTLEPCCFVGKTPPCTLALIRAGVKRVFVGSMDPNPQVAGQGLAQLRQAGIEVHTDIDAVAAQQLIEPYSKRVNTRLPWIIAKWAQTLDGCIATRSGDSRWISSPASRKQVHHLRARVDAIVVGIGTVLSDNPTLTARDVPIARVAKRVVIDPTLKVPVDCSLVKTCSKDQPVLIGVCESLIQKNPDRMKKLADQGVGFIGLPQQDHTAPFRELACLFATLAKEHQATNVLVEGGSVLLGSLLKQQLIDQVMVFVCPKLLGDRQGISAVAGLDIHQIKQCQSLQLVGFEQWDHDILLDYRVGVP